jgi:hypothetical protein
MSPSAVLPALALVLVLLPGFQAPLPSPPAVGGRRAPDLPPVGIEDAYGPLEVVDLERLAHSGRSYHRRLVQVRGVVGDLVPGRYLELREGAASVMLIPLEQGDYHDYATMVGADVDVTGVARVLPAMQATVPCHGRSVPVSQCEDEGLPALPNAQPGWPAVSITVTKMMDRGTGRSPGRSDAGTGEAVVGQFRGANLCGDLPLSTRRGGDDWVLLAADGPLWVTGRPAAGRGFRLDPGYRGDTSRWLKVAGKVMTAGGVRYLKAVKVEITARPEEAQVVPCPR